MCGIIGAISDQNVSNILLEGLSRLEYRGYDSAGLALVDENSAINRIRAVGNVSALVEEVSRADAKGTIGIAHTRWATHGAPELRNTHPHTSGDDLAIVHNGIIENYAFLREVLRQNNVEFSSDTDTEIAAHLLRQNLQDQFNEPICAGQFQAALEEIEGAFAIAAMLPGQGKAIFVAKQGSPLVVGFGKSSVFVASDPHALAGHAEEFIYLEDGDYGKLTAKSFELIDASGAAADRQRHKVEPMSDADDLGEFSHYMLKEIFEQPKAISNTLQGRLNGDHVATGAMGASFMKQLANVKFAHIVACGTSYNAGLVAGYWLERFAGVTTKVEIASEYRYRSPFIPDDAMMVVISQSGETADTLAALKLAGELNYITRLAICNVPHSSIVREADHSLLTLAGKEIGVASTKAFTTQLCALAMLTALLTRIAQGDENDIVAELESLPNLVSKILELDQEIRSMAEKIASKEHALFLGRGEYYPVAIEGALKLKEISYIHAEAYSAGELKHGPLALIDEAMPVIVVAPNNELIDKLKSNLAEVSARGGKLYVFAGDNIDLSDDELSCLIKLPESGIFSGPAAFSIPLQLLAYHIANIRGANIDKPRNLAKSVTVE